MKRIFIVATLKKLIFISILVISIFVIVILTGVNILQNKTFIDIKPANSILELEKENSKLKGILTSLLPDSSKIIVEDEYRNLYINSGYNPPPKPLAFPLKKVAEKGANVSFRVLSEDSNYLRPLYDPRWKGAFYRGWLYLDSKNIEARHRLFAFSLGGSANYDIFGSLGYYSPVGGISAPIDNHHNINLLVYDFKVTGVKVYQNQVALIGDTERTGASIISIVQNDLLPEGIDTKDFIFQLSTPGGYEIDYLHQNIIRYEYLMKQIEENTVHSSNMEESDTLNIDRLLKENAALKRELEFFIPSKDEVISEQTCTYSSSNESDLKNIAVGIREGIKVPFSIKYSNSTYKRPVYDPNWKTNYKRMWSYIPRHIEYNLHRLHSIPLKEQERYDFFGTLGFKDKYQPLNPEEYGFIIYDFDVIKAVINKNQIFFIGVPSRSGVEILSVNRNLLKHYDNYLIKLVTPDHSEVDCNIFKAQ